MFSEISEAASAASSRGPEAQAAHLRHPRPTLEEVRAEIGDCRRCPLAETRTTLVFGVGDPHARVMFIGEAPGKNEDLKGEPFVGAAGHLLDELLDEAGLVRDQVYIANILKCRPPGNRDPHPDEIELCTPYLRKQVRAIWPDVIVTLGNFSTRFILHTDRGITGLRGKVYQTGHFKVLPIFHPAAAIYDRSKVDILHADFRLLRDMLAGTDAAAREHAEQVTEPAGGGTGEEGTSSLLASSPEEALR
jgi:uracil-DNA glycosylase family 4